MFREMMLGCGLVLVTLSASNAFLFPDLKQRSGAGSSSYKIAVLQEEPYLYANGSGYVLDLLQQVTKAYAALHSGKELQLDIVPVQSWKQLMSKAKSTRFQVAFGLQIPSLELSSWPGKNMHSTVPVVHTSAKVVLRGGIGGDLQDERRTQSSQVIVLKDSPLEQLLVGAVSYPGPVYSADTPDAALDYLRLATEDAVILTEAGAADYMARKDSRDFRSLCPKEIPGTHSMHYAFFGKVSSLIGMLNEAMIALLASDSLFPIHSRYFSSTEQCSM